METTLIVPGLYGSELQHWQSWIERKLLNSVRVEQEEWDNPILPIWADTIIRYIDNHPGKIWIIAHSFGCLASVFAANKRPDRIAGAMLVAPANPGCFNVNGFQAGEVYINAIDSISLKLPKTNLGFPSVVVASTNDPWMTLDNAYKWAEHWDSHFINIGAAGHINVASGFGAWPKGLEIFESLRQSQQYLPQGIITEDGSYPQPTPDHPSNH